MQDETETGRFVGIELDSCQNLHLGWPERPARKIGFGNLDCQTELCLHEEAHFGVEEHWSKGFAWEEDYRDRTIRCKGASFGYSAWSTCLRDISGFASCVACSFDDCYA